MKTYKLRQSKKGWQIWRPWSKKWKCLGKSFDFFTLEKMVNYWESINPEYRGGLIPALEKI